MGIVNRFGNNLEVLRGLARGQRSVGNQPAQRRPVDEVHHEVVLALMHTHLVNGDNVRMPQGRRGGGLGTKAFDELSRGQRTERQQFYRDDAV